MSLEQANRYYYLAAQARKNGRNAIAEALLRQAEREKEKADMDLADVANAQREKEAMAQNVQQAPAQDTVQEAPTQETPVVQQEQGGGTPWSQKPDTPPVVSNNQGLGLAEDKFMNKDNYVPYKPSAEELANMADSKQYGVANVQGNGSANPYLADVSNFTNASYPTPKNGAVYEAYPGMSNTGDVIASAQQVVGTPNAPTVSGDSGSYSGKIYDPNTFAGAPAEGDSIWDTPEEQSARIIAERKKEEETIKNLAKKAEFAKLFPEYYKINEKDFTY